jgi:hypothetical protein
LLLHSVAQGRDLRVPIHGYPYDCDPFAALRALLFGLGISTVAASLFFDYFIAALVLAVAGWIVSSFGIRPY